ncbi:MAG: DUF4406 domain-containing protein [Clostridiales bacterium]|nr:DUF4406 domain-containing protein [Clostridiales bacterium]
MSVNFKNPEGYADPVAYQAIVNTEKTYRPVVYICSPFSGDIPLNMEKARRYCRFAVDRGAIPLAPHLLLPQFMDETAERKLALFMGKVFLGKCEEVWVFGERISEGMEAEIAKAERKNMKIRYFTDEEVHYE